MVLSTLSARRGRHAPPPLRAAAGDSSTVSTPTNSGATKSVQLEVPNPDGDPIAASFEVASTLAVHQVSLKKPLGLF